MAAFFDKHKKDIILFLIPFICLLLLFLTYFPGIIPYDGNFQWQQVQSGIITNAHPFFSTYFMLILSKIWNNPKIVILFQIFIYSLFWSIICNKTRNEKNYKLQIIYSIIISFIPIIGLYSITIWKDILYSYYLCFLGFIVYDIAVKKDFKEVSKLEYSIIGLLLFLVFSYRHNGMIVAFLYFVFLYLIIILKNKKNHKKIKNSCLILITFIVCSIIVAIPKNIYLSKSSKLNNTKNKESALSTLDTYTTWIFGIYVKNDMVEKEDLQFLNKVIPIDYWKTRYNGYFINDTFDPDRIDKEFVVKNNHQYHNLFLKYATKYPYMVLKHYSMSDALLFSINSMDKSYVYVYPFDDWTYLKFNVRSKLPLAEKVYNKVISVSFKNPIKYLYQPGLILYICLIISIFISKKFKHKKIYYIILPMVFNTMSLTPINLAQDLRYAYINYLTIITIGIILISFYKKKAE